ncbi:MerR family transcriptional regulator [Neobacillus ginsengisoli]|uniref:DNA-binding transcriptional MerR regulator n=1 Tax=Neobacillus ginsengisoli TaxID=904295 RepID=A0ABT9XS82_9BACI|nr:MerR family transcriptional regulator [Neobacillus ginsengisoli]MDQ0197804.1 DNA-binding transcriptional MerR regulator [Neobacillus ginsengisoli]
MRTYAMKEVAKKIKVPPGTIRQWEKDLNGLLVIPRTKQGARIYTDWEINLLNEIKLMYANKLGIEVIKDWLQETLEPESEAVDELPEIDTSLSIPAYEVDRIPTDEAAIKYADQFFDAMDTYKDNFLNEVKAEIRSVVRREVLDEVKKEISKGSLITVKSISDSIYKSTENTKAGIQELTETIEKSSEHTADSLQYLSSRITNVSIETSEEIYTLSQQLSETTEELAHYVDVTNKEIYSLTEEISKDREHFVEEREQYRHDISRREAAFQNMLSSFRDVAAAKEKKWWKFWS